MPGLLKYRTSAGKAVIGPLSRRAEKPVFVPGNSARSRFAALFHKDDEKIRPSIRKKHPIKVMTQIPPRRKRPTCSPKQG
jgi:hypothetical protein